jgi:2,3-bisphosphoglycerate-independent phosphoglycerate mutase
MRELGVDELPLVSGRYYAMDRDKRWALKKRTGDLFCRSTACRVRGGGSAGYAAGVTDEFIAPFCRQLSGRIHSLTAEDASFHSPADRARH